MPIRTVSPDGTVREIKRFAHGIPIYFKTDNLTSARTISSDDVQPGGSAGLSLTGSGITLGEWDGGGVRMSHQEFGGRVLVSQGTANFHSTHVAGTMIGAGTVATAKGMAPQANLRAFNWTNDISEMATEAAAGLRTSNHSYGLITGWDYNYFGDNRWAWFGNPSVNTIEDYRFGFYDQEAQDWDNVAYNAPHYLIVKSAGNDRNEGPSGPTQHWVFNGGWTLVVAARSPDGNFGYDCVSASSVAKNPLVVGAVGDIPGGYTSPAGVAMSSFSAWGPTDDGRIKPDIVANGVGLYSSLETADNAYGSLSGTSMSTPSVTGSIGLLLHHQQNLHPGDSLLASTVKGIVIHTADETGPNPGPDYMFGWGLMNTRKATDLMTLDSADGPGSHINEFSMATGDTVLIDFASTGDEPLRITLSWNDIPVGLPPVSLDPPNKILRNDLDMRLVRKIDGTEFSPWILNPASPSSAATTGDNARDNVEQILIQDPGRTLYTLRITHKTTIFNSPEDVSLIMSGNTPTIGAAIVASPETTAYAKIPGDVFSDSLTVYNTGDSTLVGTITKDPGSFWLALTEDSVNLASFDSTVIHFSVDGSLWSQWTGYDGSILFISNDQANDTLVVPVSIDVRGPTLAANPGSFVTDLDSAEIGYDTLMIRNPGYAVLNVVVSDSAGPFPFWITADPDTLAVPAGDSTAVVLTTNAGNEELGDYETTLRIVSNDSVTGQIMVPFFLNIGTRMLVSFDVGAKWNIVSIPVEPITGLKSVLFPSAVTSAFGFDDDYYTADTLRTGPGYWLKFNSAQSFEVDGYSYDLDTIPLAAGWNLVGSIFEPVSASAVTTSPGGILSSEFYRYNGGYAITDSIRPGTGYWVQASQAGNLYLSVLPGAAPKASPSIAAGKYNRITITDGSGGSQTLWFASGIEPPAKTTLPPRPQASTARSRNRSRCRTPAGRSG
jgi:hypothetical protein